MGWAEGFYWGQCKLECHSYLPTDEGKTVKVTNGAMTREQILGKDLSVMFIVPGTNRYTVSLMGDDEQPEYTEDILLGYGEYKVVQIGYNKATIQGIQSILNSHKELELLEIGDEIPITLDGPIEMVYQVGGINIYDEHDVIFVPKWLYPNTMQMNLTPTNVGGYNATPVCSWMQDAYFNMLPDDVKNLIVNTEQITSDGNINNTRPNTGGQTTIGKIFLPKTFELFGENSFTDSVELTSTTVQWPIFATAGGRVKTLGKNGVATGYWACSPCNDSSASRRWTEVGSGGAHNYGAEAHQYSGLLPCFRIEAQM